ncbi:fibronectin type III-like domain-contianing protein [Streptomyces scabiei]|uniref:fibronectin type III-like domain-contianing protein n=1 Tax=Streptomyces scabiei TaxID=1930 RepID=UPI0039F69445
MTGGARATAAFGHHDSPGGTRVRPVSARVLAQQRKEVRRASATVEAAPGESTQAVIHLPRRAFEIWDETPDAWVHVKGSYEVAAGRSIEDRRTRVTIAAP